MALALAGLGGFGGSGSLSMSMSLSGTSTVSQSGSGALSMSMALSGTGSVSGSGPPVGGYLAWYDASQITGVSDGAGLSSWPDESGNGNTLTQADSLRQPTYYKTTAGKLVNGLPAVWFNGAQSDASIIYQSAHISSATSNVTMFVVVQNNDAYPGGGVCPFFNGDGDNSGYGPAWFANQNDYGWLVGGIAWEPSTTAPNTSLHVMCLALGSSSATVYIDNTSVGTVGYSTPSTPGAMAALGKHTTSEASAYCVDGPICEAIFYGSLLSSTDRTSVYNYLNTKWG